MTTHTLTLAEFVTARLDEDEKRATHTHRLLCYMTDYDADDRFCTCRYPDRVLAQCAALRAVVGEHVAPNDETWDPTCSMEGYGLEHPDTCPTLRPIATIWRNHPDFNPVWA